MSAGIETLQAPRKSVWPALGLTLAVVMAVAIVATITRATTDQPEGRFGRHLVNAPDEVAGGVGAGSLRDFYERFEGGVPQHHFGGTPAQAPSELAGAGPTTIGGNTAANTPTEISAGMPSRAEIWARENVRR